MSETRRVIGGIDSLPLTKEGISFPRVRAWLRSPKEIEYRSLEKNFPVRGNIFLHVTQCDNVHPQKNDIGLFDCIESPGASAGWKVARTSRYLGIVYDWPEFELTLDHIRFWEWFRSFRDERPYNILLGERLAFVRWQKKEFVGPFIVAPDGKLTERDRTYCYSDLQVISIELGGKQYELIDAEHLGPGKSVFLDPREAIHRRLKILSQAGGFEWLSRSKMKELSDALSQAAAADGSEWVTSQLPSALLALTESGGIRPDTASDILKHKTIRDEIERIWRDTNRQIVERGTHEVEAVKGKLLDVNANLTAAQSQLSLATEETTKANEALMALNAKLAGAKVDAKTAFDNELKRLAQSPASLAMLGAWVGSHGSTLPAERFLVESLSLPAARICSPNLKGALIHNLRVCGLSTTCANEVAIVCLSALAAGQPIGLCSSFGDIIGQAIACAIGPSLFTAIDVPAGVLDPVDWKRILPESARIPPLVFRGINKSDCGLVLGSLRTELWDQSNGHKIPTISVIFTFDTDPNVTVEGNVPVGPIIDDRLLRLNSGKTVGEMNGCAEPNQAPPLVGAVSPEEFVEIGADLLKLTPFAAPVRQLAYRRAWSALKECGVGPHDVPRFVVKYWCLSRIPAESLGDICNSRKQLWKEDAFFEETARQLTANE